MYKKLKPPFVLHSLVSGGLAPPDPHPLLNVNVHVFIFVLTCASELMNVNQIYSYLLKLKLIIRIGPNSNYKKKTLSMVTTINDFTLSKKI